MTPKERFLAACRNEEPDLTPVWFMRQAGRYLPGYREIRKQHTILEVAKTPPLCEAVTVMPVKELGVDAAVMFADIMLPLEGMGVDFKIEENLGPVISNPIECFADVEKLRKFEAKRDVGFVLEAVSRVKAKLPDHALIGFSGAPFTIASYLIEGQPSRDFTKTKRLMFNDREAWNALMEKLSEMVVEYLSSQIAAGADAVQLFDSWVGALSSQDYDEFVAPFVEKIFRRVGAEHPEVPKIHFGTNTRHLLKAMKGDVFSIDWRTSIAQAREILGENAVIQGNLEPSVLLSDQKEFIAQRTQQVLDDNSASPGHIFNLGHGVLRDTPVENARFVARYVHENC